MRDRGVMPHAKCNCPFLSIWSLWKENQKIFYTLIFLGRVFCIIVQRDEGLFAVSDGTSGDQRLQWYAFWLHWGANAYRCDWKSIGIDARLIGFILRSLMCMFSRVNASFARMPQAAGNFAHITGITLIIYYAHSPILDDDSTFTLAECSCTTLEMFESINHNWRTIGSQGWRCNHACTWGWRRLEEAFVPLNNLICSSIVH